MDEECADSFRSAYETTKADGGKVDGVVEWIDDPEEAKKVCSLLSSIHFPCAFPSSLYLPHSVCDNNLALLMISLVVKPQRTRCPSACAAALFPAASLWPYKLVLHLLLKCINEHGLNLQTNTVVEKVTDESDGGYPDYSTVTPCRLSSVDVDFRSD